MFCRDCDQLATLQKKGAGRKISVETRERGGERGKNGRTKRNGEREEKKQRGIERGGRKHTKIFRENGKSTENEVRKKGKRTDEEG